MKKHRQYTVRESSAIYGVYTCSKCQNKVLFESIVSKSAVAMKRIYWNTKVEELDEIVENDLSKQVHSPLIKKIQTIIKESKKHNYREHKIDCKCPKCGNVELWTKVNHDKGDIWLRTVALLAISPTCLMVAMALLCENIYVFFCALGFWLVFLTTCIVRKIYLNFDVKNKELEIEKLPEETFPEIFALKKDCIEYIEKNNYIVSGYNDIETLKETNKEVKNILIAKQKERTELIEV